MLLPDLIRHNGKWRSSRLALITADEQLDWRQFSRRVELVASGLAAEGLAGERIGLVMDNEAAAVELIFGAMRAGATIVPLNTSVADDTLDALLIDADIAALAVSARHRTRIGDGPLALARRKLTTGPSDAGWRNFPQWRDGNASLPEAARASPDSLCNIIYSSGTTGTPKGIVHTQQARSDWAHDLAHALRYHSGARTLVTTGIYSNITWVAMLPTLMLGGTILLRAGFDAADVIATLSEDRVSHMSMVPIQLQRVIEDGCFTADAFATLESVMCCGSPIAAALKTELLGHLPRAFFELYGSTEGIITTLAPEEAVEARIASVGQPVPGEDLVILGANDEPLPWGEQGEVAAASRFAMTGYWRRPEATAEAVWIDHAGRRWLRSGDIGRIDPEGYLTITDRKKDMIISGGQNIYPADLEAVLITHPEVDECAVIGVPSDRWGETPVALVVMRIGHGTSRHALKDWANARLGRQQRLSAVEQRESLPRNPNGKLLKRQLRDSYLAKPAVSA